MRTGAIVLAAGASRRLGRPKQLVDWEGRPLLAHVLGQIDVWPVDEVVVVLGARSMEVRQAVDLTGVLVVENPDWSEGIASSIRAGLAAATADRAFIALGDQPDIPVVVPGTLVSVEAPVVVPAYRGVRSNPALVHRSVWPDLRSLRGDRGAAAWFREHPEIVREVAFDLDPPGDIDTEADLA
jgi:CTP:molybdopterin cytidylyltransferase MocA